MIEAEQLSLLAKIAYEALAFIMLFLTMLISTAASVHQMIPKYQVQSVCLSLITLITAIFPNDPEAAGSLSRLGILSFALVPIMLMLMIEPLLVLASVPEDISAFERIKRLINRKILQNARRHAYPIWLAQRPPKRSAFSSILLDLILIMLAFMVAFSLQNQHGGNMGVFRYDASILGISLSLLLLGLSIMRSRRDIISQIMGLLIMEHGMFLAAIRLNTSSYVTVFFLIGLFLYIFITLTLLIFLLPDLHRISGTIEIDQQEQLKG